MQATSRDANTGALFRQSVKQTRKSCQGHAERSTVVKIDPHAVVVEADCSRFSLRSSHAALWLTFPSAILERMSRPSTSPGLFAEQSAKSSSSSDWLIAHCDGGARGNPGPAGFGAVIADAQGHVLAELSEFLGHRTNNFAEYSGLLAVLAWTLEHGRSHLRVVSDSELMVKQIQGRYKVNSPDLRPLWEEARRRIGKLEGFEISHALRHKNKKADALANLAMDKGTGKTEPRVQVSGPGGEGQGSREVQGAAGAKSAGAVPPGTRPSIPGTPSVLRGFTRDGVVHILGGATLPDGQFVKIIPEGE